MSPRPSTLVALGAFLASCGSGAPRPNVLLISIDTLRPDHLGCYGYGRRTSPRIDALAAEGVLFENHVSSSSWTLPAHAALFTSVADSVHGCIEAVGTALAPRFQTLAERFRDAGYATVGFFSGPYLHPAFGLGQGFEHYENCTSYADLFEERPAETWAMAPDVMHASHRDVTNQRVHDAAERWFSTHEGKPFFAFVHLWDVHFDFIPPPPYDTMFDPDYEGDVTGEDFFFDPRIDAHLPQRDREHLVALYDGEIAWTDHVVGALFDGLAARGLVDDTIVAITSDHGTEFFEHGWKGHRTTLYDEQIRIPLVLWAPGRLPQGRRVQAQTRIVDVGPTLLELAGLPAADDVMGRSLVGLATGADSSFDPVAVSELFSVGRALRSVRTLEGKRIDDLASGEHAWFDLRTDPGEHRPRTEEESELARALERQDEAATQELERRAPEAGDAVVPELPDALHEQLRALGYTSDPGRADANDGGDGGDG